MRRSSICLSNAAYCVSGGLSRRVDGHLLRSIARFMRRADVTLSIWVASEPRTPPDSRGYVIIKRCTKGLGGEP